MKEELKFLEDQRSRLNHILICYHFEGSLKTDLNYQYKKIVERMNKIIETINKNLVVDSVPSEQKEKA